MKELQDKRLYREFPILEFDNDKKAIIEPSEQIKPINIPEHAILIFYQDIIDM